MRQREAPPRLLLTPLLPSPPSTHLTCTLSSPFQCLSIAGWEGPFLEQIGGIRRREASYIRRAARIRAFNMGLSYAIGPLVGGPVVSCLLCLCGCSVVADPTPKQHPPTTLAHPLAAAAAGPASFRCRSLGRIMLES